MDICLCGGDAFFYTWVIKKICCNILSFSFFFSVPFVKIFLFNGISFLPLYWKKSVLIFLMALFCIGVVIDYVCVKMLK